MATAHTGRWLMAGRQWLQLALAAAHARDGSLAQFRIRTVT